LGALSRSFSLPLLRFLISRKIYSKSEDFLKELPFSPRIIFRMMMRSHNHDDFSGRPINNTNSPKQDCFKVDPNPSPGTVSPHHHLRFPYLHGMQNGFFASFSISALSKSTLSDKKILPPSLGCYLEDFSLLQRLIRKYFTKDAE
jgi:hypothetical protein